MTFVADRVCINLVTISSVSSESDELEDEEDDNDDSDDDFPAGFAGFALGVCDSPVVFGAGVNAIISESLSESESDSELPILIGCWFRIQRSGTPIG